MLFSKQDPVSQFMQGELSEYKLQKRLQKLTDKDAASFDTDSWCRFLIDNNEMHHSMPVSVETKQLIIAHLSEEQLIDIAVKTHGNDYICALAINDMKEQESLQKVLQFYHRISPFRVYMWEGEKLIYTDNPVGTRFDRGGLSVWVLLQKIDREHFRKAWNNCGGQSKWVDQLRNRSVDGRCFSGYGFPGWGEKGAMNYMDLLPEVEHMIIIAESGVEVKAADSAIWQ